MTPEERKTALLKDLFLLLENIYADTHDPNTEVLNTYPHIDSIPYYLDEIQSAVDGK